MDAPVFSSRKKKGHLTEVQVNRIVKAAAMRVPGLDRQVATKVSHIGDVLDRLLGL